MGLHSIWLQASEEKQKKLSGLTHRMIYLRGLNALQRAEQQPEEQQFEINALKKKVERLANLLNKQIIRSLELEEEIKQFRGGKNVV